MKSNQSRHNKPSLLRRILSSAPATVVVNLLIVYLLYFICRIVFVAGNWQFFADTMTPSRLFRLFVGGLHFDSSAICYTNALYILLVLLPLHWKEVRWYQLMTKIIFVTVNSLCLLVDLADSVFFEFRGQRTTAAIFGEFGGEGNLASIILPQMLSHWYLVLLFILMVLALVFLYRYPPRPAVRPLGRYYLIQSISLVVIGFLAFCGMRGNVFFLSATRPISNNFAFTYTNNARETAIVLNTPFSMIRTVGKHRFPTPDYFQSPAELEAVFNPVVSPADSLPEMRRKNVVILMVESFAQEFIGGLNKDLDGGTYKGYTPYTDRMLDSCMYFDLSISNNFWSIDGLPSIMASIPRYKDSFVTSPYSNNHINSLATELKNAGYQTAFFHGGDNQTLGLQAFTTQAGFDRYYGMTEFNADPRFGGSSQFDGYWGIWDEPFLQFFAAKLTETPEPFLAGVFTLSSHDPFRVPEQYRDRFPEEGKYPLHKCIRYADFAIHQFFETARRQPWFYNTIFVITADHTSSKRTHDYYLNFMGDYLVPILFYDPSGELPRGRQPGIAQQIDIMPTLLGYLGYDRPFVAFGKDLLRTPPEESWAVNTMRTPTYFMGDYVLSYDGENVLSFYNRRQDPFCKTDLKGKGIPEEAIMKRRLQAFMQSYIDRMNRDALTVSEK